MSTNSILYFYSHSGLKRDEPAIIDYYEDGNIKCKHYFIKRWYYIKSGPSKISYYPNGEIENEENKNEYVSYRYIPINDI
jgi:hypothetical protein